MILYGIIALIIGIVLWGVGRGIPLPILVIAGQVFAAIGFILLVIGFVLLVIPAAGAPLALA